MSKKILIVEDNEEDRMIMRRYLEKAGFRDLVFVHDEAEAVQMFKDAAPDLVISDTLLPGTDGFKVCESIKKASDGKAKVIIMTGSVDAVDAVKARQAGADDYVAKTSDCAPLLDAVPKLI